MSRTKFLSLFLILTIIHLASCDSGGENSTTPPEPTTMPTPMPTSMPTPMPTPMPTSMPTPMPTPMPTSMPTPMPTSMPTPMPTSTPTPMPTSMPTPMPTSMPTPMPTQNPNIENQFSLTNAFPNLNFENPLDIQNPEDGTNRLFIAEQSGVIRVLNNLPNTQVNEISVRNVTSSVFLDIENQVLEGGEQGLLGFAFHPNFANNGYFYVHYIASNPRRNVISRFSVSPTNPDSTDIQSEMILLEIPQPDTNHNGGQLAFGPQDGYLYISIGDGGDDENESQDLTSLLGTILRIDVDNPQGLLNYGIPNSNPFANNSSGFSEEIYAYGLRNPWRIAFDPVSGRLWSGDVGQSSREEINIINNGGNYGWPIVEGTLCFSPPQGCNPSDFELPVLEYGRNQGGSVIGGVLYYGEEFPELFGMYIYADFISGKVWALDYNGANVVDNVELLQFNPFSIVAFGLDEQGELYIASFDGNVYQLQRIDNL